MPADPSAATADELEARAAAEAELLRAEARKLRECESDRLRQRAEWALQWLVKRIDLLDPGSTMVVPNHQQVMAGRIREALNALKADCG